ncbi:MAG: Gfo/Idh/MocA family oxidoreductase, partial [Opitutaceae bacterium]|nr:Gfo/Idh/MocA family oxidoreductase [Opitutaceae bacterium]
MTTKLNWGIIGTGNISSTFAKGIINSTTGQLTSISSRTKASADTFGDKFNVPQRYDSYQELLKDPHVQAVYIGTPHPTHATIAIRCAEAGKHILCEKPITLNHSDTMAVVEAAIANGVFLMEAFMYRCHPQTQKLIELLKQNVIGDVRLIKATFGFHCDFDADSRLFSQKLGGGGILDVGCYPVSFARLVAGIIQGKEYDEPIAVKGFSHLGATGVDEWASALLKFKNGLIAEVSTSTQLNQDNTAVVYGSKGSIHIASPWLVAKDGGTWTIEVRKNGEDSQLISGDERLSLYSIEADTVAEAIHAGKSETQAMSWGDTFGNMRTLDAWRREIGLTYEEEAIGAKRPPLNGRALHPSSTNNMRYARIKGL